MHAPSGMRGYRVKPPSGALGYSFPGMGSAESDVVIEVIYERVKRNEFSNDGIEIIFDSPKYF